MNLRKRFSSQILVLSMFFVFAIFSLSSGFIFQVTKVKEYREEITSINKEIKDTKLEIKKIKKLQNTNDLEIEARNRLNMVRPGEIIYVDIKEGN